jgi:hypothetical protein
MMTLVEKVCSVDDCNNAKRANGLCPKHLRRLKVHGNTEIVLPSYRKTSDGLCTIEGCDKKHRGLGYCGSHYKKFKKWGDPLYVYEVKTNFCAVDTCDKKVDSLGLCDTHAGRFRRRGSAYGPFPRAKAVYSKETKTETKYKNYNVKNHPFLPDGVMAEHRYVMANMIGRPLFSHENVHHKNGVRHDNRPENLELWTVWQPPGQRVEDKIRWAIEILETYAPENLGER